MSHTKEDLESLTIPDLKKILKEAGKSQTGRKSDLVERILQTEGNEAQEVSEETQEVSEETQEVSEETQEVSEETQEVTEEAQKVTEEAQEVTEEAQNAAEEAPKVKSEETSAILSSSKAPLVEPQVAPIGAEDKEQLKEKLKNKLISSRKKSSLFSPPPSLNIRLDNLQRPFNVKSFLDFLREKTSLDYLQEEHLWINMIKTHAYVSLRSLEDALLLKDCLSGLKFPEIQSNTVLLEANYSEVSVKDCPSSAEAKKKPNEWKEFVLKQAKTVEIPEENIRKRKNSNEEFEEPQEHKRFKEFYYDEAQFQEIRLTQARPSLSWCPVAQSVIDQRYSQESR